MGWKRIQEELVAEDAWIIEGNYGGTVDIRLARADTILFLECGRFTSLWRIGQRWFKYRGGTRPDMAPGCPEKLDGEFIRWIWKFPGKDRPWILAKIQQHSRGKTVAHLRGTAEAGRFLAGVAGQRDA